MKLPEKRSRLGNKVDGAGPFDIVFKEEPQHILVTGRTGGGKSRLLNKLTRDTSINAWASR